MNAPKLQPINDELLSAFELDAAKVYADPDYPTSDAAVILRYLGEAAARIRRAELQRDELLAALLAVSPWKLQDCWCLDDDHGGGKNHGPACLLARAAIAKAKGVDNPAAKRAFDDAKGRGA